MQGFGLNVSSFQWEFLHKALAVKASPVLCQSLYSLTFQLISECLSVAGPR